MPRPRTVPPPPEDLRRLLEWAERHEVAARLDDVFIGNDGPPGTFLPGRAGEVLTYRQLLLEPAPRASPRRRAMNVDDDAREFLHRMANLIVARREHSAWMAAHGRDPEDPVAAALLEKLRAERQELAGAREAPVRPAGTFEPVTVQVSRDPTPMLQYQERELSDRSSHDPCDEAAPPDAAVAIHLLGWEEGPLRWARTRSTRGRPGCSELVPGEVSAAQRTSALEAMIDFVRDPRRQAEHDTLGELLRLPAWRLALGSLDESLALLEARAGRPGRTAGARHPPVGVPEERVAFRVTTPAGHVVVEAVVQKRRAQGFTKGAHLPWFSLPERKDLTAADRRAYQAYDDRFARTATRGPFWAGGTSPPAQTFGILRALIDHPAVFLDPEPGKPRDTTYDGGRLDIRHGRLRLRFVSAADGSVTPYLELLGVALLTSEAIISLRDDQHFIHLHRPEGQPPQVLLAQLEPQAAALLRALALAPAPTRFPAEAHDALATRLESLQEAMDIEFPAQWTRTVAAADRRLLARLELLASGAVQVRLLVRPVKRGPVFAPGEGPALVLEGQGRDRHGARRDLHGEREGAHALAEGLGLTGEQELERWCWRVGEGDPALHLVGSLRDLGEESVLVEWADDEHRLLPLGTVSRADMRMQVADRRDWFAVGGGAVVKEKGRGKRRGLLASDQVVPLAELLAAIREGRRYVRVGAQGFVRIEQSLRDALARAEGAVFFHGDVIQVSPAAHDSLLGLVEEEAQIEASVAFALLRRRIKEGGDIVPRLPAELEATLRPYQKAGVQWLVRLAHWGAGAILADEMGLGKTVQTLALLLHRAADGPALVVAPTSVVGNWVDEAARFAPQLKVRLYRGAQRADALTGLGPGDLLVTSYAVATMDAQALGRHTFASLVLDEAQAVKNASTDRARALRGLDAAWRLGLTGTPVENHLGELWSLLRVIAPGLLGSWEQFRARYAVPIEKFGDEARRRGLTALLRPFVLRRMKNEVARELPPRTEVVRTVELSGEEQRLYEELRVATLEEVRNRKKAPDRDGQDLRFVLLAALTRLRQLCCHPRLVYPHTHAGSAKATYLLELLADLQQGGHKALVFSQFRSFLELLEPRLTHQGFRVLVLDGTTPAETRERRIAAFQAGEADLFLISLKAGGFGLNLTAADTVIHLDPWWNPAVEDQATARAHRIGQQRPVTAVRLVARGTIEEAVLQLHAAKRALATAVLEGSDLAATLGTEELIDLIRRPPLA